jgi:uncharacterized protein (TIGR02145 family)
LQFPTQDVLESLPVITTQPTPFTFSRLKDEFGDPNGPATVSGITLSVSATGGAGDLIYQWYKNGISLGSDNGAQTATYTVPQIEAGVANWGLDKYQCKVTNDLSFVASDLAEVAIGCGARSGANGWLKFMCHNLGATPLSNAVDITEFTVSTDTISEAINKGWLFQWGRPADGHQWRTSVLKTGQSNTAWTVADVGTDEFFIGSNSWRTTNTVNDNPYATAGNNPCPTGWVVPTQDQWSSLFLGGVTNANHNTAGTFNKWVKQGSASYKLQPDAATTTLFLPAAGYRNYSTGVLTDVGTRGHYWSRSASPSAAASAYYLLFYGQTVYPSDAFRRGSGYSVRCVASQN